MYSNQTKDLYLLNIELVDMKVNMAVSRTIDQVVNQIASLRNEVHVQINELKTEMCEELHDIRHEMRDGFTTLGNRITAVEASLGNRVTAVETKLGIVDESRKEIRNRLMDYCFKAGWILLGATVSYFVLQLQVLIK